MVANIRLEFLLIVISAAEPVLVEVPTDPHEPQASEWLAE